MNSYELNLSLSYLFAGIVLLGLSLFVYFKNKRNPVNKAFAIYSFCIAWWSLASILMINSQTEATATFFDRICLMGTIFIPTTLIHFTLTLLQAEQKRKNIIKLCYLISSCFLILNFTPLFVKHTAPIYHIRYFTVPGIGYYIFLLYFTSSTILGTYLLYHGFRSSSESHKKQQFLYLFWGTLLGYVGGSFNYSLVLKIPPYWLAPWGNYLIGIYGIIIAYAIIKHQLMDIRIVIKKSIVYSISIATISIIYLLSILTLEKLVQKTFGYHSLTISISTAFILGLLFIPLRYRIQHFMDRYFFKGSAEEISNQNEQLRKEIAQSEKYKTLATLATGIAHEVKNPLTAIKTFCEYLPKRLDDKEFLIKFSSIVGHEIDRIDEMTHQLLDYGKPAPLALKKTDINKLIENTVDILNSKFIAQNIKINKNLTSDGYLLNIDPNQIKQALLNILLNSIDSMPNSGELSISTSITSTSYFMIKIEDTGSGISKEDLSQIFDPFFSKKDNGTGLGLSITHGLIENHKGIIQIKSKVGSGTVVRIDLPC